MAHYCFLNENNIVTEVIVGKDEGEDGINWEQHYGEFRGQVCKRTSYNTVGGLHSNGKTPFRKNYAGIGFSYDPVRDAFIPPKPYESWLLNEDSCLWQPPVPYPTDVLEGTFYTWDEETLSWKEVAIDLADNALGSKPKVVDAKGDLVVGTGADAAARLPVGSNGDTLVADSATTTGLAWSAEL